MCDTCFGQRQIRKLFWSRRLRSMQVSLCWWSVNCCVQACKQTQRDTQETKRAKCAHVGDTNNKGSLFAGSFPVRCLRFFLSGRTPCLLHLRQCPVATARGKTPTVNESRSTRTVSQRRRPPVQEPNPITAILQKYMTRQRHDVSFRARGPIKVTTPARAHKRPRRPLSSVGMCHASSARRQPLLRSCSSLRT